MGGFLSVAIQVDEAVRNCLDREAGYDISVVVQFGLDELVVLFIAGAFVLECVEGESIVFLGQERCSVFVINPEVVLRDAGLFLKGVFYAVPFTGTENT